MKPQRTGGLVTLHRYGARHFSALAERSRSAYAYGGSDAAKRQRMSDVRAKRTLIGRYGVEEGTRRWEALVARHRQQFAAQPAAERG